MSLSVRLYYPDYNEEHRHVLVEFARGIPGAEIVPVEDYGPSDVAVIFGTYKYAVPQTGPKRRIIRQQAQRKKHVVYVETGYLRRSEYYAVSVDGMLGLGRPYYHKSPPDRFEALGLDVKPVEKRPNGHVLLTGQVPWDANVQDYPYAEWLLQTFHDLCREHGINRVIFRPHPRFMEKTPGIQFGIPSEFHSTNLNIEADLNGCHKLVTFNSNSAIDAILNGVAADVRGPGSIWTQTGSLHDVAYAQWHPDEMASGEAWEHVVRALA